VVTCGAELTHRVRTSDVPTLIASAIELAGVRDGFLPQHVVVAEIWAGPGRSFPNLSVHSKCGRGEDEGEEEFHKEVGLAKEVGSEPLCAVRKWGHATGATGATGIKE